ncbi:Probable transposable element [Penicillium roqueforti FM164]|uniref:Probable transposable element n=1 Tax=Penicillium roqueforti (strain FM164) TaxID=1365484 RepID=W6PQT8_PENRF|nr:Probable transposable element [Penicillium roqueforti FM164]
MCTDMHTLPVTNLLHRSTAQIREFRRYHRSPFTVHHSPFTVHRSSLYQVAKALKSIDMETLAAIHPFKLALWVKRVQSDSQDVPETQTEAGGVMRILVNRSAGE